MDDFCSPWIGAKNAEWVKILKFGIKRNFSKGSIIIGNGQTVDNLYYLHAGKVKLSYIGKDGREKILMYMDKGNLFGEVPFFDHKPMYRQFTAIEACEVYTFSRECFCEVIVPQYPELMFNLVEVLVNKTRAFAVQASDLGSIISRVCKVLIYVADRGRVNHEEGKMVCNQGISKEELASILGVHRTTLFSAIACLKEMGVIEEISKKRLIIHDYQQLVSIAEGE